jgi:hypothetical protein
MPVIVALHQPATANQRHCQLAKPLKLLMLLIRRLEVSHHVMAYKQLTLLLGLLQKP